MRRLVKSAWAPVLTITFVVLFNEYLIYHVTVSRGCSWPKHNAGHKVLAVADTHLLGRHRGHWFDKLRREWQMHRSFQTVVSVLKPDTVFILGDLLDEGPISNQIELLEYFERFRSLFSVPDGVKRFSVFGNHDIGFHDEVSSPRLGLFSQQFSRGLADHIEIDGNHFVLINSMAMERDGCHLCAAAEHEMERLSHKFKCAEQINESDDCHNYPKMNYSRPIVMQHIPLFRLSDAKCGNDYDTAPVPLKHEAYREGTDCLSEKSTDYILRTLNPRAVFDGHSHYACKTWWPAPYNTWEWTVPSLSWRNTAQPAVLLVVVTPNNLLVEKCFLPNEFTVFKIYILAALCILVWIALRLKGCRLLRSENCLTNDKVK